MSFDLSATDGSVRTRSARDALSGVRFDDPPPRAKPHHLDSPRMELLHKRALDDFQRELDRQRDNRFQMATDAAFYDNEQWREEDKKTLEDRGQVPLVYNVISASVDWVTGTERRGRTDHKVLPRRKEEGQPAQRKSELLKYLSDVNKTVFERSRAFEDAVKTGIGWLEDGIDDDAEDELIYSRYESWRNILHDSSCTRTDLKDARYVFRAKWIDLDVALSLFPDRAGVIEMSRDYDHSYAQIDYYGDEAMDEQEDSLDDREYAYTNPGHGFDRPRIRVIEMWYKDPSIPFERMRGGTFAGEIFDRYSTAHRSELDMGRARTTPGRGGQMHVAIFTPRGMLHHSPSPYRHNKFPFTPIWAYRRDSDGLPYGMIRRLRDIQEDVNKRASKALHILSTNKTIMDENALADGMSTEEYLEEIARPDAVIVKRQGTEIDINVDRDLSQYQLELMSRSIEMIQRSSGVTDDNMGRRTNAVSGIAIERRQDQGSLASARFFDNLRHALQLQGEKQLSLIEQFMSEEKAFRITNTRGQPEYVTVNDGRPENDIVRSKADFVISEQDWQNTMRQAAVAELLQLMPTLGPQVTLLILDLLIDEMDLKNRDEIVKRIRRETGQQDPDADDDSPESVAKQQAADQAQQFQQQMAIANLEKLRAEAAQKYAAAEQALANARSANTKQISERITAQNQALDAAHKVLAAPASADIADVITHEAGLDARSTIESQSAPAAPEQLPAGPPAPPSTSQDQL